MEPFVAAIGWIEAYPVTGAALLASLGFGIVAYTKWVLTRRDKNPYIEPTFYSFGKQYHVVAVHEYLPDAHASGYRQIQHSRPDQWKTHIEVRSSLGNLRHRIIPKDPKAHLVVVLRPRKAAREKHVRFNR